MKPIFLMPFLVATTALANPMETTMKANELAQILSSEAFCGLTFNQDAISSWIDDNVPVDAMDFTSQLSLYSMAVESQTATMSESQKTAHCRAVERTSKHFGFLSQ